MDGLIERMIRAAKLDPSLYEEVEADPQTIGQAVVVVVLASLAGGVGTMHVAGIQGLFVGAVASLIGWGLWSVLTYLIGTKLLPEPQTEADVGELLRTLGFAGSPGVLRVFAVVPGLSLIVSIVASFWMLAAMVVAVRQALDYSSTARAVAVCVVGFAIQLLISSVLFAPMAVR